MINKKVLDNAIKDIATTHIATLQSVKGDKATVVIAEQVYPNIRYIGRLSLDINIGKQVIVSFIDKDLSDGAIVGVVASGGNGDDVYTKTEVDTLLAIRDARILALEIKVGV